MKYQPLIDFIVFLGNNPAWALAIAIAIILINILALHVLWRKLGENENLKYEFITIIAHKFRTPLTQTKWLIESLLPEEKEPRTKDGLKQMAQANQKLIDLTGTLIELTDSDDPARTGYTFERVSLCTFAREIGASFKEAFHEKNIFFAVQCPETDVVAKIDRARMSFVFIRERMHIYVPRPESGRLHFLAQIIQLEKESRHISGRPRNGHSPSRHGQIVHEIFPLKRRQSRRHRRFRSRPISGSNNNEKT